ncbi:flavin reductase family protein (plasmid) [Cupriavidus basilensis]
MDQRAFRNALGQFATGVAIVTTTVDGENLGSTISSFNSVSLDPPLVLFSLIRNSLGFNQWKNAGAFCIAILGEDQEDLSNRFAKAGTDKWTGIPVERAENGAPRLSGAIAYFECEPYDNCDGGDHEIFVCRVTNFEVVQPGVPSLIFYSGKYRQLATLEAA